MTQEFDARAVLCADELARQVIEHARDLLNDALPRYFPETLSGDESPDMVFGFERAITRALIEYVDAWYKGNRTATPFLTWRNATGDDVLCTCGNTVDSDGFHPCDGRGNEVEPTPALWPLPLIICGRCRAVYLQNVDALGEGAVLIGAYV